MRLHADSNPRQILSYRQFARNQRPPSPLLATLLHLPGSACWLLLMSGAISGRLLKWFAHRDELIAGLWILAISTAIASLVLYAAPGVRKTGCVMLNLAINLCGLAFTLAAIPFAVIFSTMFIR